MEYKVGDIVMVGRVVWIGGRTETKKKKGGCTAETIRIRFHLSIFV